MNGIVHKDVGIDGKYSNYLGSFADVFQTNSMIFFKFASL